MKISCEWLRSCCPDLAIGPEELAERLLLAGFPVESIERLAGGDLVLDVEVTSNRPDLLCHLGIAREVAALTGGRLAGPRVSPAGEPGPELRRMTSVRVETAACPYYTARIIERVKVGPSPGWLARRLEAVGLRPVNNVVDITNYVLHEYSQPLHAFDHARLAEGRIVVRQARAGERLTSIDGRPRDLDESMMVIADAVHPVAIAGIMGGLDTEVGPGTTTILLESAYFDPLSVRGTARRLGLFSDSSFRFERGVDPGGVEPASNRATDLIVELCGGRAAPGLAADGSLEPVLPGQSKVQMRLSRMRRLLGIDVDPKRVVEILSSLGLGPVGLADDVVTVNVPTFRQDLRREADLIEEVARVVGYDRIPVHERVEVEVRPPSFRQSAIRRIARALCSQGFFETVSISFVPGEEAELFARGGPGHLEVSHPSRRQEGALRRSLAVSLLKARRHNETVQAGRADLFEIASVFDPPADAVGLPGEPLRLGLCTDGDFRFCRGVLESAVQAVGGAQTGLTLEPLERAEFTSGTAATVALNGLVIGLMGQPSEAVRARFGLHREVVVAEIDVAPLLELAGRPRKFSPISRFPAIERDVSVIVSEAATWRDIERVVRQAGPAELEGIELTDIYRGQPVPPGSKSVTFTLRYRSADGTLTNEQANGFVGAAVSALSRELGAVVRDK